jgi:hypothetical protein
VIVRIVLIPLFVKQIHASRKMQLIQPEMQKIQAKYKGKTDPESRQKMTQETMDLYKKTGTNPFSRRAADPVAVAVLLRDCSPCSTTSRRSPRASSRSVRSP